ncbi:MAG: phage antirepressor KilAC domain-containing protein [Alphaproteobacteria bacterium]|nr:phage antirepressor KilAC domain-containing protein [Alphaproteobacteria bacterium]
MNNGELKIFNYKNNEVRTTVKDGEIWWVLKDVCDILGLSEPHRVASRLEKDERTLMTVPDNLGRRQNTTIINEPGLYKVILRSDKPEAKKFMHWITHEVLPSIRKHGAYITSAKMEELMNDPDTWVKLIRTLQQERREKELLQNKIEKDKPKVIFCDAVSASDSDILVSEMAKILRGNGIDIGEHRLFERLRNEGFLIRRKGCDKNIPTQRSMNLGLFKITETAITHSDGRVTVAKTSKITGKGQVYFIKYFLAHKKDNDNE